MKQKRRITSYWQKWKALTTVHGDLCFYCRSEVATCLDHVLPYSYTDNDDASNLRPSCALCNVLVSDKVFASVADKTAYILERRRRRGGLRQSVCCTCGVPYVYREQSPSLFMCPECYDREYDTKLSSRKTWQKWLQLLSDAGMFIWIYRRAGDLHRGLRQHGAIFLRMCLVQAIQELEAKELRGVEIDSNAVLRTSAAE
jgi:hypothetical protein